MKAKGISSFGAVCALSAGFSVVSVSLVAGLHLLASSTGASGVSEGLEGVLAGCWFTACFVLGVWGRVGRSGVARLSLGRAMLLGLVAGGVGWAMLALAWGLVVGVASDTSGQGPAFAVNSMFFLLWGAAWSAVARERPSRVRVAGEIA